MKTRNFTLCALGLAAAITLGGGTASAQRAPSTTRIPVRKDQPAEPVVTKTDTVRVIVHDTVTIRGRTDTVVRTVQGMTVHDTVMQMLPLQKLPGTYFGIGAGVSVPMNDWRNSTKDGPNVQAMVGWYPKDADWGLRLDGIANFFAHRATDCSACPDPRLYELNGDLTYRFPLDRRSTLNPVIYIMGGGGIDKFTDFLPYLNSENKMVVAGGSTFLNGTGGAIKVTAAQAGDKSLFFNYNAGLGIDFNAGPAHMYVESKYTTIMTTNGNSHYWPISVGFKFY
jgi:hypothetical protein